MREYYNLSYVLNSNSFFASNNTNILIFLDILFCIKDTLNVFDNFENKQKKVWSNFFDMQKVCIFWKFIQYTMNWDKTQMLKKLLSDKVNGTKNTLLFLSVYFFLFLVVLLNRDSCMNWSVRFISLKVSVGLSIFNSVSFLLKFIIFFNKKHGLFFFKTS